MAIKKVKKQKVKARPVADTSEGRKPCASCSVERKADQFPFVMPSLLDPTEYACSLACYKKWQGRRTAELRKPRGQSSGAGR